MSDEDELQALLEQHVEHDPGCVEGVSFYPGDPTIPTSDMWMWSVRHENLAQTVRVQERMKPSGEIEQRCRNRYDDGEVSEWTQWYSALEQWAVKR